MIWALYSLRDSWTHFVNFTQTRSVSMKLTHTGVTVAMPGCTTRDGEFVVPCMSGSCDLFHLL